MPNTTLNRFGRYEDRSGVPVAIVFSGKRYNLVSVGDDKLGALDEADEYRSMRYRARAVRVGAGRWAVYAREE